MEMNGNNFLTVDELEILLLSAALPIFGGFAKLFMSSRKLTVYQFISCSIISGFTGVMGSFLVRAIDLSSFMQSFVIGMSGFVAPAALSTFTTIFEKRLATGSLLSRDDNTTRTSKRG
jgi:hypothetical protein